MWLFVKKKMYTIGIYTYCIPIMIISITPTGESTERCFQITDAVRDVKNVCVSRIPVNEAFT